METEGNEIIFLSDSNNDHKLQNELHILVKLSIEPLRPSRKCLWRHQNMGAIRYYTITIK